MTIMWRRRGAGGPALHAVTALATSTSSIQGLAVDATSVYWTDYYAGVVDRVPIAGGAVVVVSSAAATPGPIFAYGSGIYWAGSSSIVSKAAGNLATGRTGGPNGVTSDGVNVYWTEQGGGVFSVAIGGGAVTTLLAAGTPFGPVAIATDGTTVFWDTAGVLKRTPVGGGTVTTMGTNPNATQAARLIVASGTVYVLAASGGAGARICSIPVASSTFTSIYSNGTHTFADMTMDATNFYFIDSKLVLQRPIAGGAAITIVSDSNNLSCLAQDAANIYFSQGITNGLIKSVGK